MDIDAFAPGDTPGGLTNTYEIKILLCYLLTAAKEPLPFSLLNEVLAGESLVNYFELGQAVENLCQSGHIAVEKTASGEEGYLVTELGRTTSKLLERSIPYSAREKSVKAALTLLAKRRREKETKVEIEKTADGYTVSCHILDIGSDLACVRLFVADKFQAETVKENFLKDPNRVYTGLLALLTHDQEMLEKALGEGAAD